MHRDPAAPLTHRRSRTLNPFKDARLRRRGGRLRGHRRCARAQAPAPAGIAAAADCATGVRAAAARRRPALAGASSGPVMVRSRVPIVLHGPLCQEREACSHGCVLCSVLPRIANFCRPTPVNWLTARHCPAGEAEADRSAGCAPQLCGEAGAGAAPTECQWSLLCPCPDSSWAGDMSALSNPAAHVLFVTCSYFVGHARTRPLQRRRSRSP